jgi:hypothetical protein
MSACARVSIVVVFSLIAAFPAFWRHAGIFTVIHAKCNG